MLNLCCLHALCTVRKSLTHVSSPGVIYEAILHDTLESVVADSASSKKKKKGDAEEESGSVGSVAGGGRYDNLVGMFDPKKRTVPCVGVSFGIERLFAVTERKMRSQDKKVRSISMQSITLSIP